MGAAISDGGVQLRTANTDPLCRLAGEQKSRGEREVAESMLGMLRQSILLNVRALLGGKVQRGDLRTMTTDIAFLWDLSAASKQVET